MNKMILVINLQEMEVNEFDLYKALEYMWIDYDDYITIYKKIEDIKKKYLDHVTDMDGDNWVVVIDTEKKVFKSVNISASIVVSGLESEELDELI